MNLFFISVIMMTVVVSVSFILFLYAAMKKGKENSEESPIDNEKS